MGDSITDLWRLEEYFPGKPYVNRGIGGQTTPQMLVRMYPDVIDLKPAVMVLLAGTNDIARNTGPMTSDMIQENIMAMTELAQHHGIKVILCSILPVSDYPFMKQQSGQAVAAAGPGQGASRVKMTDGRPPADILKLNAWMKDYAARANAIYVDYFKAVVDEKGRLKDGYSADGLHPNAEGYKTRCRQSWEQQFRKHYRNRIAHKICPFFVDIEFLADHVENGHYVFFAEFMHFGGIRNRSSSGSDLSLVTFVDTNTA